MFSSNVGFRRRTVSEGYNQLLPPPPPSSSKRTSSASHRHSLDESGTASSSATVKRVVLRKYTVETTTPRSGLADRIARSEAENIGGFWSRRLSGQRRSYPCGSKQIEPDVAQWRREIQDKENTSPITPERVKTYAKPRGPRPLSKVSVTSAQKSSSHLVPSDILSSSSATDMQATSMVSINPVIRTDFAFPDRLPDVTSKALAKTKDSNSSTRAPERGKDSNYGVTYRPLLPPGLSMQKMPSENKVGSKLDKLDKSIIREKERRRFVLELSLNRLFGGKRAPSNRSQPQPQPAALTVHSGRKHISLLPPVDLPSSLAIPPVPSIPIPPIPPDIDTWRPRSRPRSVRSVKSAMSVKSTKSNKSCKSGKSAKRKSSLRSRKRKTGLARIVIELAKGEEIVAMDAEAIQEAAQVRDILEQLRQMKAS